MARTTTLALLLVCLSLGQALAQDAAAPAGGISLCESDPELKELAAGNPTIQACCGQVDDILNNPQTYLAQGFTSLIPVLGCSQYPPFELSSQCYNDILSSGANCYMEMQVMLDFFNETGLLNQALDVAGGLKDGSTDTSNLTAVASQFPTPEEFQKMAKDWLPTGKAKLAALTGSEDINPSCCASIGKLVEDKCACEETPMSFITERMDKVGIKLSDYAAFAGEIVSGMNCAAANDLQIYPECTA